MSILRIIFAGEIKKAETKTVAGKQLVELSICKKNRGKAGEEDTFTWVKVALWEPAAFQLPLLVAGAFIAGSGDVQLRSYEGKNGKDKSLEARCTSFDVEVTGGAARTAAPRPSRASSPSTPAAAPTGGDDEPPF